jgi:hypothetical protein
MKRGDGNGEVMAVEGWSGALPVGRGPRASPLAEEWAARTTIITNRKVRRGLRLGIEGGKALGD